MIAGVQYHRDVGGGLRDYVRPKVFGWYRFLRKSWDVVLSIENRVGFHLFVFGDSVVICGSLKQYSVIVGVGSKRYS